MTNWKERKRHIRKSFDYDPLITIPMMEGADVSLAMMQGRIRNEFDRQGCSSVTIIDQYFLPTDIDFIINTFASLQGRKIRIITKLADAQDSVQKQRNELIFKKAIAEIEQKKIFSEFNVYKTNVPMHDRYFISDDLTEKSPCFSLGTSINMLFKHYTCLLKVENNSFKRQIKRFVEVCIQNGCEIRGQING